MHHSDAKNRTIMCRIRHSILFFALLVQSTHLPTLFCYIILLFLSFFFCYSVFVKLYSVVFLMMHLPPFLRILLHHLPDSDYVRCQYIYFLFGFLTMIFHSVQRVGFHLYMAVSTLQLTSIRNLSEYWQLLRGHTSRCRSIFGFHILLSDTAVESCVTFKPRKAPIQLI